jgi:transposase
MAAKKKKSAGPRGKYEKMKVSDRLPEIEGWARDGYRDKDIYTALGISHQTYYTWLDKYPELAEAVRRGKEVIDAEVENKLFESAMGREFWEVTEELGPEGDLIVTKRVKKYVKPEVGAQIFWLKNRKPDVWRDKQHTEISGGIEVSNLDYMSDDELEKALKELNMDD